MSPLSTPAFVGPIDHRAGLRGVHHDPSQRLGVSRLHDTGPDLPDLAVLHAGDDGLAEHPVLAQLLLRVLVLLWPKAVELVGDLMSECATLEDDDWHLGGGTALATEWKHRTSTDIDILIAPGLNMTGLGPEAIGRIERRIEEQGGRRLDAPDQKLSVDYGPDGKVDIFSSGRQLPGHEEVVEIDGSRVGRLSDARIFAGKLRRAI